MPGGREIKTMAKKNETIYICTLDRFGYTLTTAGKTEKQAREAIIKEYVKTYKKWNNGADPRKEERRNGTYYDEMLEDLYVYELPIGEVEWR